MGGETRLTILNTGNPTGLKVMVQHGEVRALFDLGLEHSPGRAPFTQGVVPRPGRELGDYQAVGMAPRLDGVFESWDGRTALFLSHLHLDHVGLVPFVHPDLPLHFAAALEPLRAAAEAAGVVPWRRGGAGRGLEWGEEVAWGEISIRALPVDHDLPGAAGYLVTTPDLSIAYTGDHRSHGLHPALTAAYMDAVAGVDVMIEEAVTLGFASLQPPPEGGAAPPGPTEAEMVAAFADLVGSAPGLVVVNCYEMNRERVAAFGAACARAGRRFLMEPVSAAVAGWDGRLPADLSGVAADPRGHCIQLAFTSLPRLLDLRVPPGSIYVHSNGVPLGAFDPAWPVLEAWMRVLNLELVRLGCTGHSLPDDLFREVARVRPRVVLPVHTAAPERLAVPGVARLLPEPGRAYTVDDLVREAEVL